MKKDKKKENYLDKIPYIPEDRKWELKGGIVYVTQINKGFYNSIAQKLFKTPKTSQNKNQIKRMNSLSVNYFNRSIYDIGMLVADKYGEKANPLYERLSQYIKTLDNLGFIQFK